VVASALVNSHLELVPAAPRLYQLEALLKVLLPLLLLPSQAHDAPPLPPAAAAPVCRPATAVPAFARGLAPDPRLACRLTARLGCLLPFSLLFVSVCCRSGSMEQTLRMTSRRLP
jgi:hypothetical protein